MSILQSRRGHEAWTDYWRLWKAQPKSSLCLFWGGRWFILCCSFGAHGSIHQRQEDPHLRRSDLLYFDYLALLSSRLSPWFSLSHAQRDGTRGLQLSHSLLYLPNQTIRIRIRMDGQSLDIYVDTVNQEEGAAKVICMYLWKS